MRTKKWALTFLVVFAGIILFIAHSARAGCEVASLDELIVESGNAPGTKLSGPITVFYKFISGDPAGEFEADMYFFLRLRHGSLFYQFAGGPERVIIPTNFIDEIPDIIGTFFEEVVIPELYPGCDPTIPESCPDVVLKSYDMDVDWEAPGENSGLFFFIADIVIAVQD